MSDPSLPPLENLFAAARAEERDFSRLELAFETRLMARLREERPDSLFTFAWRLCPFFAALALAAVLWTQFFPSAARGEREMLTDLTQWGDAQTLLSYMTGDASGR